MVFEKTPECMPVSLQIAIPITQCPFTQEKPMSRKSTKPSLMSDNVYSAFPPASPHTTIRADVSSVSYSRKIQGLVIEKTNDVRQTICTVLRKRSSTYRPYIKHHRWHFVFLSRSTYCTNGLIRWHQCQRCGLVLSDAIMKRNRVPECPGEVWTMDAMPTTAEESHSVMPNLKGYRGPRPRRGA